MKLIDALKETRRLIETVGWTKGCAARDSSGNKVAPINKDAVCFCLHGAIERAVHHQYDDAQKVNRLLRKLLGGQLVSVWNDQPKRNLGEVLELLDSAIATQLRVVA